jgi:hypothetical protein
MHTFGREHLQCSLAQTLVKGQSHVPDSPHIDHGRYFRLRTS